MAGIADASAGRFGAATYRRCNCNNGGIALAWISKFSGRRSVDSGTCYGNGDYPRRLDVALGH